MRASHLGAELVALEVLILQIAHGHRLSAVVGLEHTLGPVDHALERASQGRYVRCERVFAIPLQSCAAYEMVQGMNRRSTSRASPTGAARRSRKATQEATARYDTPSFGTPSFLPPGQVSAAHLGLLVVGTEPLEEPGRLLQLLHHVHYVLRVFHKVVFQHLHSVSRWYVRGCGRDRMALVSDRAPRRANTRRG